MNRETMEFDVVIVGAGPAGLACSCRLAQQARDRGVEISIAVLEKGSEVGAHILSGALLETRALDELFPDWRDQGAPLKTEVKEDRVYFLTSQGKSIKMPNWLVPRTMHNQGNYIVSLGNVCRWLGERAEELGVDVFPGFAAAEVLYDDDGRVVGVATADLGLDRDGTQKDTWQEGIELRARYTVFAEGSRGHLGKQLIENFCLDIDVSPQHYAIGFKELWKVKPEQHSPGLVVHTAGWPTSESKSSGGGFLYHLEDGLVSVGLIIDLNYANPHLSPFDEFQRFKHHAKIAPTLTGGERLGYGARAIAKGGLNSLVRMALPGAVLIGCEAGTLNFAKIKGSHTAMKSGMIAAEVLADALAQEQQPPELDELELKFRASWLYDELKRARNFGPALHKFGTWLGGAFNYIDQNWFRGKMPLTLKDTGHDCETLIDARASKPIDYPKPDGKLSFDKTSSVFLTGTNHEENQPCHLQLGDAAVPIGVNLPRWAEPAQRYCPAGVYEVVEEEEKAKFVINAQNCIHCKTCDIKDPSQNITWVTPEGGGGPNYSNM